MTDPRRRARADHVAGLQRHESADVADEIGDAEDHLGGGAVLHALAVEIEPQTQVLRIAHLVGGDQPRPQRGERVAALALDPLAAALVLERPLRDVVHGAVAGDVAQRLVLGHVPGGRADHRGQLDFPVNPLALARQHHRIVRAVERGRRLEEQDRLLGDRVAALGGVVGIVEADAHELADVRDGHPEPRVALDGRKPGGIERGEPRQRGGIDVDVVPGEVANAPLAVDQAGLFAAGRAVADQFHAFNPRNV